MRFSPGEVNEYVRTFYDDVCSDFTCPFRLAVAVHPIFGCVTAVGNIQAVAKCSFRVIHVLEDRAQHDVTAVLVHESNQTARARSIGSKLRFDIAFYLFGRANVGQQHADDRRNLRAPVVELNWRNANALFEN